MSTMTTNYNLIKPAQSDFYNVEDFNNNADIIDAQMKANEDAAGKSADVLGDTDLSGLAITTVTENVRHLSRLAEAGKINAAGFHNSIYRGKNLGSSVTEAQWAQIGAGTFDDLFIGDYWNINSIIWRIAAFDYWYRHGDTECTAHHVVIVPDSNLLAADGSATHWMNATNITTGAYVGSDFYTGNNSNTGKSQCRTKAQNAFGSAHILTHREHLQNAVKDGYESGGAWYDSDIEIMSEKMVYGSQIFGNQMSGTAIPNLYTIDNAQLPLFALDHSKICNRAGWWLRDVASASLFANVASYGGADYGAASYGWVGVRPAFGIRA